MIRRLKLPLFLAACLLSNATVFADPIVGLFNTGVDASGSLLPVGPGTPDPHYMILSGPGISIPVGAVTYFNGAYLADGPNSRWISANANGGNGAGDYDFQTTFSLTGLDPTTASITGMFGADNHIIQTLINGAVVPGATVTGFGSLAAFSIPLGSPFVAGLNTLDFIVRDDGPPMALRVDALAGIASPQGGGAVPEPTTLVLLGLAFAGIGLVKRRKQN